METQDDKISFSLKNKLLVIFGILIIISIVSLTLSMIYLFREDKKAYTYQKQSTETLLASKEFLSMSQKTIALLKQTVGILGYENKIPESIQIQVRNLLMNQDTVVYLKVFQYDTKEKSQLLSSNFIHTKKNTELSLVEDDFKFDTTLIENNLDNLKVNGFSFFNASEPNKTPLLGVLMSDSKNIKNDKLQIAAAFVPLDQFSKDMNGLKVSVATYQGVSLFDTEPKTLFEDKNILNDPLFQFSQKQKTTSGSVEFQKDNENFLGTFIKPDLGLVVTSYARWDDVVKATYELIEKAIVISTVIFSLMIILIIIFSRSLTQPLQDLYRATKDVSKGHFNVKLKPRGADEIGVLGKSFFIMSSKINELIEKEKEKAKLDNELEIASTVQKTLIPPSRYEDEHILINSFYQPASQCGGDWWGYFAIENKFCFLIADATGHGFPSALITASARSCFSAIHKVAHENPDINFSPGKLLSYANKSIYDSAQGQILMTFFIGIIDYKEGKIFYSSAGHNPPWLIHNDNGKLDFKSLITDGTRLGEVENLTDYSEKSLEFKKGSSIFLYTDGLIEGKNDDGLMYGKKAVKTELENSIVYGGETAINSITQGFLAHNGSKALDDDVTVAIITIK